MTGWQQKRAFLFSHPRTGSNLLTRILSDQPDWQISDYLFFDAFQFTKDAFWDTPLEDVPLHAREEHRGLVEIGRERMGEVLHKSNCDKRKHLFLKYHAHLITPVDIAYNESSYCGMSNGASKVARDLDHNTQTNPTIFSDDLMLSWTPIILIRNPILVYESWLRAEGEPYPSLESPYAKIYTTLRFQRAILDWYRSRTNELQHHVIVLDADDVIENRGVMEKVCDLIGMDKRKMLYEWQASPIPAKFQTNERFKRFMRTISNSTCIDFEKASGDICLGDKELAWKGEFGPERAAALASRVRESWMDYQYLRSMRLQ